MSEAIVEVPPITSQSWRWQGWQIRYQQAGVTGIPLVLIHGFGASSVHWRKNLVGLATHNRVYAIDLIGFGQSAKPTPGSAIAYTFATWSQQIIDFCREIVGDRAVLVGNSIGCIVAMQAAVDAPDWVLGIASLDCSLRLLHDRKRATLPWYRQAPTPWIQALLGYRPLGHWFFARLARPQVIKRILQQAYGQTEAVTDELVDLLLQPAFEPGAADVFLAFVRYSQGPLAEDLLPLITCPVLLIWGEADPWEPIALGRSLAAYPCVQDFIPLPGVGHCPQDEVPEQVNALLMAWVDRQNSHGIEPTPEQPYADPSDTHAAPA